MAAMVDNPRSQASKATGQCLQRYLAATMFVWNVKVRVHIKLKFILSDSFL